MKALHHLQTGLAALAIASVLAVPSPAKADTASTAAIVAGAGAIVGALLYDGSHRPYYVRNNHRYYVSQQVATYYRGHHHAGYHGNDGYHGNGNNGYHGNDGNRGNDQHGHDGH